MMEPDQIDMMNEHELREELRKLIARPSSCTVESIVRNMWNHFADGYNQWDSLGQDEKDTLFKISVANVSEAARMNGTCPSAGSHSPLECPECGNLCFPRTETKDGGTTYVCNARNEHGDFRPLRFKIDGDGNVTW